MRINKNDKKIYIFEALIFLVVLVFGFSLIRAPILVRTYGSIVSFAVLGTLAGFVMGFPRDHHYLRGSAIRTIITVLLATGIIIYTAGIFFGFNRGLGGFSLNILFAGLIPELLLVLVMVKE